MYKKLLIIITSIILLISFGVLIGTQNDFYASSNKPPAVNSEGAILIDAQTGEILYSKNEHKKLFPASTTKVMTALLAIEKGGLNSEFTADSETVNISSDSSSAGIKSGEKFTIEQLLYLTLLPSGNDAANALGQYVCNGNLEDFYDLMNKRAKELGCKNTFFWNASGINTSPASKDKHMTTAYDLSLIMKRSVTIPKFVEVISTANYKMAPTNKSGSRNYKNTNRLITKSSKEYYQYCIGGKTGWTTPAGNTLVSYSVKDGVKLICVVMKANGAAAAARESKNLFEYGFNLKTNNTIKTANPNTSTTARTSAGTSAKITTANKTTAYTATSPVATDSITNDVTSVVTSDAVTNASTTAEITAAGTAAYTGTSNMTYITSDNMPGNTREPDAMKSDKSMDKWMIMNWVLLFVIICVVAIIKIVRRKLNGKIKKE